MKTFNIYKPFLFLRKHHLLFAIEPNNSAGLYKIERIWFRRYRIDPFNAKSKFTVDCMIDCTSVISNLTDSTDISFVIPKKYFFKSKFTGRYSILYSSEKHFCKDMKKVLCSK